jgi:hypothetical protein
MGLRRPVEIVVVDGRQGLAEDGKVFDRFVDAVIVDVVACQFCEQDEMIADILLDKPVSIVAGDHGIGQVHVLDLGLQLAPIVLGDLAAEDDRDLVQPPMVRLASSRRSPSMSSAARRRKMRLSQNSTCEKNSRCWQPACSRSLALKKSVSCASTFGHRSPDVEA